MDVRDRTWHVVVDAAEGGGVCGAMSASGSIGPLGIVLRVSRVIYRLYVTLRLEIQVTTTDAIVWDSG